MPAQKRPFECTVDEALNDFCYDPEPSPNGGKKRRKRVYEPIPLDPLPASQKASTAFPGLFQTLDPLLPAEQGGVLEDDDVDRMPVKNKVSSLLLLLKDS